MNTDYFEIAKGLMLAQSQQILGSLKEAEATQEPTLIQCENCKDHFTEDDIITDEYGVSFCSQHCMDEFIQKGLEDSEEEPDYTCHVCRGTGEGQNDYCSCYNCKGKGYVYPKGDIEP